MTPLGEDPHQQERFIESLGRFTREHHAGHWAGTFSAFMHDILARAPERVARSSHQYIWDMLRATASVDDDGRHRCALFADELFGIDEALERVIDYFKAAAAGSEVGRRLLLLLGPPSGGKSTMVILPKRGLEDYSHTDEGALYAIAGCPVHESPLHLVPHSMRAGCRGTYGIDIAGELCPIAARADFAKNNQLFARFMAMAGGRILEQSAARASRDIHAVREAILAPKFHFGAPAVAVHRVGADWSLELRHDYLPDGRGLDLPQAERVVEYVGRVWRRPVSLHTVDFRGVVRVLPAVKSNAGA